MREDGEADTGNIRLGFETAKIQSYQNVSGDLWKGSIRRKRVPPAHVAANSNLRNRGASLIISPLRTRHERGYATNFEQLRTRDKLRGERSTTVTERVSLRACVAVQRDRREHLLELSCQDYSTKAKQYVPNAARHAPLLQRKGPRNTRKERQYVRSVHIS